MASAGAELGSTWRARPRTWRHSIAPHRIRNRQRDDSSRRACSVETVREIADMITTAQILYRVLAVVSFLVAFGIGCYGLQHLHLSSLTLPKVYLAWGILCLSQVRHRGIDGMDLPVAGNRDCGLGGPAILSCQHRDAFRTDHRSVHGRGAPGPGDSGGSGAVMQRLSVIALARNKRPELIGIKGVWSPELVRSMAPVASRPG